MPAASIVSVIESYGISLQPAGSEHVGLCPFHDDHTPSMYVSEPKNVWYCFACQIGGDAITFIMQIEQIGFREAIRKTNPGAIGSQVVKTEDQQFKKWAKETYLRVAEIMRECRDKLAIAEEINWREEIETLHREYETLFDFYMTLKGKTVQLKRDLYENKDLVEMVLFSLDDNGGWEGVGKKRFFQAKDRRDFEDWLLRAIKTRNR